MSLRAAASLIVLACALHGSALAAQSGADEPTEASRLFDRGASLAAERKYEEAASAFRASYELRPRKEALFAWAQMVRLAGNCPEAIALYRKFLASPDLQPAQIEAAQLSISRCEQAAARPEPAPAPAPPPPAAPAPLLVAPPPIAPAVTVTAPPARRSRGAVVLGASLLSGAVLALGASGTFFVLSRGDERTASAAESWESYYEPASRARSRQRIAFGLLGTGVLLAGGAVVEWLATTPKASMTAWLGDGGAGVGVRGTY